MQGVKFVLGIKGGKSEVQSVLLDKKAFTQDTAKKWLREHNYITQIEDGKRYYRARQKDPNLYEKFRTIKAGSQRNPMTADELVRQFHGREPMGETIIDSTITTPKLADLGRLVSLEVATEEGDITIDFTGEDVRLASNANGTQLYVIGDKIDLSELIEPERDIVEVGDILAVTYEADKHHIDPQAPMGTYVHEFGDEGGELPILLWNCVTEELLIVGGSYEVKAEGIVN